MRHRNKKRARRPRAKLACERLETRQLLAADFVMAMHNSFDPEDVNDDGICSPIDAMLVINSLNSADSASAESFVDVNGDGVRSPVDAMMVINRLNRGNNNKPPRNGGNETPTQLTEFRSIDGTGNNAENPEIGSTGQQLLRFADSDYADGISAPAGADRPSPREISNALAAIDELAAPSDRQLSAFLYVWGQFLDHDIDLTMPPDADGEAFDIAVPTGDPYFDPTGTGNQFISLTRSRFDPSTGTDVDNPREQFNQITAWIDGSVIYGSNADTANSLRAFGGGRLLVSDGDLPPVDADGSFLAGDVRANENIELTSMHTLFIREHNWWADRIASQSPNLTDEEVYQQARAIVGAEIQAITYQEFLPALLGRDALSPYRGYDPTVNAGIANEFSTAAFRLGHSLINDDVEFFGDDGRAVQDEVPLREAFFNPDLLRETGVDSILKYVASSLSQEIDNQVVDSLRNFLFGQPGQGGFDLASLNIQRGRDHGLADYNSVREAYGLPRVESFEEISSDPEIQRKLAELYGTVDNIDLWVGGLAEDHVAGSSVGSLFHAIIVDQFERLRDGDRFWYQNVFSGRELGQLENTTLADIIRRNTDVANIQDNVFFLKAEVRGQLYIDVNADGLFGRTDQPLAGVTIELLDDEGGLVTSTVSDANGRYRFTEFHETGDFQVRVVIPDDMQVVGSDTRDVLISRGDLVIGRQDFGLQPLDSVITDPLDPRPRDPRLPKSGRGPR